MSISKSRVSIRDKFLANCHLQIGQYWSWRKDYKKAKNHFRHAFNYDLYNGSVVYHYGLAYINLKKYRGAEVMIRILDQLDKKYRKYADDLRLRRNLHPYSKHAVEN